MNKNPKNGLPRIPSGGHFTLSRGKFLDGTLRVYFGPGQHPGVTQTYAPPTDWPAAGRLLRVPQVVCLSCLYPRIDEWSGPDPSKTFNDYYLEYGGDPATETSATAEVVNAGTAELDRTQGVFDDAKAAIEAIRPGLTYVISAKYATISAPSFDWNYNMAGDLMVMAPPDLDPPRYFGTDFLHVYVGHIFDGGGFAATAFSVSGPHVDPVSLAADTGYQNARARLVPSSVNFRRHATVLYSATSLNWTDNVPGGDTSVQTLISDGYSIVGNELDHISALNDQRLQDIAADLADYGVTYAGDGTGISSGALVAAIASHYGFDPVTGADVG